MKPLITMSNALREKIREYIKSEKDISELIKDINIQNEDLSHAVISNFNASNQNISGCRLVGAKIQNAQMINTIAHNVQFNYADLSFSNCNGLDAQNSNFLNANCSFVKFINADLRGCNFCNMTMTLSPQYTFKAKLSKNILELLKRIWLIIEDNTENRLES